MIYSKFTGNEWQEASTIGAESGVSHSPALNFGVSAAYLRQLDNTKIMKSKHGGPVSFSHGFGFPCYDSMFLPTFMLGIALLKRVKLDLPSVQNLRIPIDFMTYPLIN